MTMAMLLGISFQIVDDLLDYGGDAAKPPVKMWAMISANAS